MTPAQADGDNILSVSANEMNGGADALAHVLYDLGCVMMSRLSLRFHGRFTLLRIPVNSSRRSSNRPRKN